MSSDEESSISTRSTPTTEQRLSKLIKDNQVLKSACIQERKVKAELQDKVTHLQTELKLKQDEIDNLNFNSERISKRIDSLQEQLNTKGAQKGGSFLGNLLNAKEKDMNNRLAKDLEVLQEELAVKIDENEQLHIHMFEYKQQQTSKINELEEKLNAYIDNNKELTVNMENYKNEHDKLKTFVDDLTDRGRQLEIELNNSMKKLVDTESKFTIQVKTISEKLAVQREKYTQKVPFDDISNASLQSYNRSYYKKELIGKQQEWMQRGLGATKQIVKHMDSLQEDFRARVKLFINQANNEGNENYRMLSQKLINSSGLLFNNVKAILTNAQEVFSFFGELNSKNFSKRVEELHKQITLLDERLQNIVNNIGSLANNLSSCTSILRIIFDEEYEFIDNISFLKKKNGKILEFLTDLERQFGTLKSLITALLQHPRGDKSLFDNEVRFVEKILLRFKAIKRTIDSLCSECKEKYQAENSVFDTLSAQSPAAVISYNFSPEIASNFRSYNNNCMNHFTYLVQSFSSLVSILEQLISGVGGKEEESADNTKFRPILSLDAGYLKNLSRLNKLNSKLKTAPSGISYKDSLTNKSSLDSLLVKEGEYKRQVESLQMALRNAESLIEGNPEDTMSYESEATTENINDKDAKQENERLKKKFDALLAKYQEICTQNNISDDFSKTLTEEDSITTPAATKRQESLFEDARGHPFESHNENVLQGYQRLSMQLLDNKMKSIPLNNITSADLENSEKYKLWFGKVKQKVLDLALQTETYEQKLNQSKQDNDGLQKNINHETQQREKFEKRCKELEKDLAKSTTDIGSIKANYEEQIKALSEHVISLQGKKK